MSAERRRSARHLVGEPAEVHLGPRTVAAQVNDVSAHGMGLTLPAGESPKIGDLIWVLTGSVAAYAITATIVRIASDHRIGIQFDEILHGSELERIESLPLVE